MARTNEEAAAYMRAWRAKRRGTINVHAACDERAARLEAVIAAQNEEIGELKSALAGFSHAMVAGPEADELDSVL
jgi:hypothetical protein